MQEKTGRHGVKQTWSFQSINYKLTLFDCVPITALFPEMQQNAI